MIQVNKAASIREAGDSLRSSLEWFGEFGLFTGRVARAALTPPFEFKELLSQLDEIGSRSIFLVMVAGAAIGVVLTLETRNTLLHFGAESSLPAIIMVSIMRESGPIVTGLIVSGRVGAGIGAALGSMKVTEQIDAMEVSAVNPYQYLVATRVIACAVAMPLLTVACDFSGVLSGWLANTLAKPISLDLFLNIGLRQVTFSDFLPPTFKTVVFGLIIGLVSSFQGMQAHGGTEGVGRAATNSVVLSSLFIIMGAKIIQISLE